jgi:hypothetical protein
MGQGRSRAIIAHSQQINITVVAISRNLGVLLLSMAQVLSKNPGVCLSSPFPTTSCGL